MSKARPDYCPESRYRGVAKSGGSGARSGASGIFTLIAEVQLAAGQLAEARGAVDGGLAISAQTGEHFLDAELHRLRGAASNLIR